MNKDLSLKNLTCPERPLEPHTSQQILKSVYDCTKSSIVLVSPEYDIIFYNKAAGDCSSLLYGRKLMIGESILNYTQEGDEELFEEFKKNLQKVMRDNTVIVTERKAYFPNLSFWVRIEYTPVHDDNHRLSGIFINIHDITDRKKNKEQQRKLNHIAWSLSHETRQPVSTILGLISIFDKTSMTRDNLEILNLLNDTIGKLDDIIREAVVRASRPS
jgi:PAS domain S-box-containing protein